VKRILFNTLTQNGNTKYAQSSIIVGALRPSIISLGFWVKKTQFESIYPSLFTTILSLATININPTNVLLGTPVSTTTNNTGVDFSSVTTTMTKIAEVGDYIRIRLTFSSIVWRETFAGTTIPYYFTFNNAVSSGKELEFIDFTVLFNTEINGSIVYPDGATIFGTDTLLSVISNVTKIKNDIIDLQPKNNNLKLTKSGDYIYLSSEYDATKNIVKKVQYNRAATFANNSNVNFVSSYLALKNADQKTSLTAIKEEGDDICPAYLNGSYIGGNHGWNQPLVLTKTGHGKTFEDIGSIYIDSASKQFVILRIVDANNLWIVSTNQATDGFTYTFVAPTGALVYVSDGLNTGTISTFTVASVGNMQTSIAKIGTSIILDDKTAITTDGEYSCKYADVIEEYNVIDLPSIISKITLNRPVGGYSSNVVFSGLGADYLFKISIVYRFMDNGTTLIFTNFRNYKKLVFNFHGFIQASALTSGNIYIPKSLPISDGVKTWDFRKVENWTSAPNAAINLTSAYWENPLSPPDRIVNSNSDIIHHVGYLTDRGAGFNRKDKISDSIYLYTSRKLYPKGDSIQRNLEANSFISSVAFRSYRNPANNPTGRTNYDWFELDGIIYIYLDYHGSLSDKIVSENTWIGRKIEVLEKNDKTTLLCDVVSSSIEIISTATATENGYIVMKLI
jgi:hypothetical protein